MPLSGRRGDQRGHPGGAPGSAPHRPDRRHHVAGDEAPPSTVELPILFNPGRRSWPLPGLRLPPPMVRRSLMAPPLPYPDAPVFGPRPPPLVPVQSGGLADLGAGISRWFQSIGPGGQVLLLGGVFLLVLLAASLDD